MKSPTIDYSAIFSDVKNLLDYECRGVNIGVYVLASAGLAYSIRRVRPVSKFSTASKIPNHFVSRHEILRGEYAGVQYSPVRLLVNHRAPIYLPLWHSSKPPLPVKLWGVEIVSLNAVNWLECIAKGQKVSFRPITKNNEDLVSTVTLHLKQPKTKLKENVDVGQKLVELGFAKASIPEAIKKNTIESKLAPAILKAEIIAKNQRNGIWSDILPPIPFYVKFLKKGQAISVQYALFTLKYLLKLPNIILIGMWVGIKTLVKLPFMLKGRNFKSSK